MNILFRLFTKSYHVIDKYQCCVLIQVEREKLRKRRIHLFLLVHLDYKGAMFVPTISEDIITQVSEEIEGRVTEKLYQEFSKTESRILGALSKLDDFFLNPQVRKHPGILTWKTRNQLGIVPRIIPSRSGVLCLSVTQVS